MNDADGPKGVATRLARRLAALPEAAMRDVAMCEFVERTDDDAAAPVLEQIHRRGDRGGPPFDVALLTLVRVLNADHLPYQQVAQIYESAKAQGFHTLAQLFLNARASLEVGPGQDDATRELTLGHRKSMARSGDQDTLLRLLQAPEAEVVPHLLQNPRLRERDVVALAARRPPDPRIQRLLAASPRWITRYPVKRAIVLNPGTPPELSLRLLSFLLKADLRQVRTSPTLPDVVRDAASSIEAERRSDTQPPSD